MSGFGYALGAATNLLGGIMTNSANAKQNSKNRRLALHMFNTQLDETYQRTTEDMKKAGINPMLAVTNGGNSASANVPSNIPMHDPVPDLATVMNSAASSAKLNAEADLLNAQKLSILNDIDVKNADLEIRQSQLDNEIQRLEIERGRLGNETVKTGSEKAHRDAQIKEIDSNLETAKKQRALIQSQTERTSSGVTRERYGNKVGPAVELGKHLSDLIFDQPVSAMSSQKRKSYIKDKVSRVLQLLRTSDKSTSAVGMRPPINYRKNQLQRERDFFRRKNNPRGGYHQSDFR